MEVKIPGVQLLRKRSDRSDLISAQTNSKLPTAITMSKFMESFSSASYSKWDDDRAWSSQEWKN